MRTPEEIEREIWGKGVSLQRAIRLAVQEAVEEVYQVECAYCKAGNVPFKTSGNIWMHGDNLAETGYRCGADAIRDHFKKAGY